MTTARCARHEHWPHEYPVDLFQLAIRGPWTDDEIADLFDVAVLSARQYTQSQIAAELGTDGWNRTRVHRLQSRLRQAITSARSELLEVA